MESAIIATSYPNILRKFMKENGVEVIRADLQDNGALARLPDVPNIIYMAGRKFGTEGHEWETWGMNATLSAFVAERFRNSRIVVFSSANIYAISPAFRGGSCETAYSATKGAVISFVKGLAKELGPSGIRVNAVAPGAVDTDMLSCFSAEDKAAMAENSALCRIGRPEDIARVTAFLASGAASFITGQVVGADGGMII